MSKAPPGEIYVSELVRRRTAETLHLESAGAPAAEGQGGARRAPIASTGASAQHAPAGRPLQRCRSSGRSSELAALQAALADSAAGRGQDRRHLGRGGDGEVAAGRRVRAQHKTARRITWRLASARHSARAPLFVWREIWRALLGLTPGSARTRSRSPRSSARCEAIDPASSRARRCSTPCSAYHDPRQDPLTSSFDPKLRKTSLENLLADCLRARAAAEPLVLVLEDCHWLDPLSRDLLDVIARTAATAPVLDRLRLSPRRRALQGLALGALPDIRSSRCRRWPRRT